MKVNEDSRLSHRAMVLSEIGVDDDGKSVSALQFQCESRIESIYLCTISDDTHNNSS